MYHLVERPVLPASLQVAVGRVLGPCGLTNEVLASQPSLPLRLMTLPTRLCHQYKLKCWEKGLGSPPSPSLLTHIVALGLKGLGIWKGKPSRGAWGGDEGECSFFKIVNVQEVSSFGPRHASLKASTCPLHRLPPIACTSLQCDDVRLWGWGLLSDPTNSARIPLAVFCE